MRTETEGDRPRSPRKRLEESDIAELITAYRDSATSLAATHDVSLRSANPLLKHRRIRRTPPTRRSTKTTPTTAYPSPLVPGHSPRAQPHEFVSQVVSRPPRRGVIFR